jgi:RNA polymerase sigma-70 factor (ECF subfamily)
MVETGQEQAWIEASRTGDPAAFEQLIGMHQRMVHGITYRMTGSMEDADDMAQETFAQAYQKLSSFRGESKFSSWLCRVAINLCLNLRRHEGRREEIHRHWAAANLDEDTDSSRPSLTAELNARVQAALDSLPAEQRAAITLTVYQEMSHAEAGCVMGCAEATVSWRVFKARRRLRQMLASDLEGENGR